MENNENFKNQQTQAPTNPPEITFNPSSTPKKPIYKKWWFWLIIGFVVLAIVIGSSSESNDNQGSGTTEDGSQNSSAASGSISKNNLGDYNVVIESCRLAKDYSGKPIAIIKYKFTNDSDDAISFWLAIDDNVYQNDIGLNICYLAADSANYSTDNQYKDVRKGATLEVEVAYELNDTSTPIQVEVCEYISFNNKKVTKTFTIN